MTKFDDLIEWAAGVLASLFLLLVIAVVVQLVRHPERACYPYKNCSSLEKFAVKGGGSHGE